MIQVEIKKSHQKILEMKIYGHAQSDVYGKDLVCAGVSAACVGIANALVKRGFLERGTIQVEEGLTDIHVFQYQEDIQVVLETLEVILESIKESYPKYIKIMKMEV